MIVSLSLLCETTQRDLPFPAQLGFLSFKDVLQLEGQSDTFGSSPLSSSWPPVWCLWGLCTLLAHHHPIETLTQQSVSLHNCVLPRVKCNHYNIKINSQN